MRIVIIPNDKGTPAGKLADAELHFDTELLGGLKLVGFAIWESQWNNGLNVTLPSRDYQVNGERRKYDLVRPIGGTAFQTQALKAAILEAFEASSQQTAPSAVERVVRQTWRDASPAPKAAPPARQTSYARPAGQHSRPTRPAPAATGTDDDIPF